jgi:hypothetical protein
MSRKRAPRPPRYIRKLRYLQRIGALPSSVGVHEIQVLHDDGCRHWQQPGHCTCDPTLRLAWSQPDAAQN